MDDYDREFYLLSNDEAIRSAAPVLSAVRKWFHVKSVVDFGCGEAPWLRSWKEHGAEEVLGLDGEHVDRGRLLIDDSEFRVVDLRQPVRLGRSFDLVQSLEVGEHLPRGASETFVDTLTAHGPLVLFSAAPPGQGGEGHVNERPYAFWRGLFDQRGYVLVDAIRPAIRDDVRVSFWYRYNTFLYVHRELLREVPVELQRCALEQGPIPDLAPRSLQVFRWYLRTLPAWWVTFVAKRVLKPLQLRQRKRRAQ
jgi:hypothetical protein